MRIYTSIPDFHSHSRPVVTVGVFDGVHKGHLEILNRLITSAAEKQCESAVITFEPHPRLLLGNASEVRLLQSLDEKIERFREAGIDILLVIPFDTAFSALTPSDFIQNILVDKFKVSKVIMGYDHFFGRDRMGDFTLLEEMGAQYDFTVEQVEPVEHCHQVVSSSAIREALSEGNISRANCMLGYKYSVRGRVVRGNQIGKLIGFPTANIQPYEKHKLIPALGVYASQIKWNGNLYTGMSNIGIRPTIDANRLTVEVNIFNFNEEIYSEAISLFFLERIRDEKRFGGLEQLKEQLLRDQSEVARIFENLDPNIL